MLYVLDATYFGDNKYHLGWKLNEASEMLFIEISSDEYCLILSQKSAVTYVAYCHAIWYLHTQADNTTHMPAHCISSEQRQYCDKLFELRQNEDLTIREFKEAVNKLLRKYGIYCSVGIASVMPINTKRFDNASLYKTLTEEGAI